MSANVKKESESIQNFKSRQNLEMEKLHRKKLSLDNYQNDIRMKELNVKTEKERLFTLQRTLENFRHDYVKELDKNPGVFEKKPRLDNYMGQT